VSGPLRLLFVVSELGWHGGIGRVVAGAARALAARGHELHVAGAADVEPAALAGTALRLWPVRRAGPGRTADLVSLVRRTHPDVVHLHAAHPPAQRLLALRIARAGRPRPALAVSPYSSRGIVKRGAALALRGADRVVTSSQWAAAQALAAGARAVSVAPAGVDLPQAGGEDREALVGFLGRLHATKGVDVLLDAFTRAAAMRTDWRLVVAGDGGERFALERIAGQTLCADRIAFVGPVSGPARAQLFARVAIGVVPSRRDHFPGVLLEWMAHATACVASGVGGIPEIADGGHAALLVPPADPAALALALADLMDDTDRRRSLARAGRLAAERLAWPVVIERWEAIYWELLAERR
jgi:glycosyltransferase involved in cell wall biosynthesis